MTTRSGLKTVHAGAKNGGGYLMLALSGHVPESDWLARQPFYF